MYALAHCVGRYAQGGLYAIPSAAALDGGPFVNLASDDEGELLCVVALTRHGDRTPKQKLKFTTREPTLLSMVTKHGRNAVDELKVKKVRLMEGAAGWKSPRSRLSTPRHLPPWAIERLGPLLPTPERRLSRSDARRGLRSPPRAGPESRRVSSSTRRRSSARASRRWSTGFRRSSRLEIMASTQSDGTAPSASLDYRKAQAAPTHPGAPPEHLGGLPWPQEPA